LVKELTDDLPVAREELENPQAISDRRSPMNQTWNITFGAANARVLLWTRTEHIGALK
jgi:hypothetical protein